MTIDMVSAQAEQSDKTLESTAHALRDELGRVLSRLAATKGQAVPAFRFSMLQSGHDCAPLDDLAVKQQLIEMWRARFPRGTQRVLPDGDVTKGDYPLLWVNGGGDKALLVRGRLANDDFIAENGLGEVAALTAQDARAGVWIALEPRARTVSARKREPETASDWFVYALSKHRGVFFEGIIATFVISALALFTALYTMQVYDRVIPTAGFSTLWVLTVGVLISIGLEFLMKQARSHIVEKASKKVDMDLSGVFFGKALDIRLDARPSTVGTFAAQIKQFDSVRNFLTSSTLFIMADAPFALFFIGVIALLAGPVALVPAVMVPVSVFAGWFTCRRLKELTALHMEESNCRNGVLIEAIDGIESVKAAGGIWKLGDRYRDLTSTLADNEIKMRKINLRASHLTQTIQQINYVGLVAVGAYLVTSGDLSMGGLIACSIITGRALGPIAQIPGLINQWHNARISLDVLDNIMAMPDDRERDQRLLVPEHCRGSMRLDNLKFAYQEERPIVDIEAMRFKIGERIAVVGPVGSGKTTLIKLLSGLFKPSSGQIFLDDIDMQQLAPEFLREHIGYLPQDVRLFNGTLRDNLTLGLPTPSDSRILEAANLTGLDRVITAHTHGLELMISEGGRGLSGGQRQLVGLTRLLMAKPKILLLDEPTASMDSQLEHNVMKHLFEEMPSDSLVLVVTHKPAVLPRVERIVVMDKGRIVLDDARDKVLQLMQRPTSPPLREMHSGPTSHGTSS